MIDRRRIVALIAATAGSLPFIRLAPAAQDQPTMEPVLRPEDFGARGDGTTNDTVAFERLCAFVNRNSGGTIELRPTTYVIGRQRRASPNGRSAYDWSTLLAFEGCSKSLIIHGNGAKLRCANGLRYGAFDPATGAATQHALPFYGERERVSPYWAMIMVKACSGPIEISDLELDGNLNGLRIGGPWGDSGRQLAAYGLALYDNSGPELVRNVFTHHHALDGLLIDGLNSNRRGRSRFEKVRSEYNGRQGCSIVGGRGYDFVECAFNHTGQGGLSSAPGAGVDIEAENKQIRDLTFARCQFMNNAGPGIVADSGDSEHALFTGCTFVGTTFWSAWPRKPYIRFEDCLFVGAIANPFGDEQNPARATQFLRCQFRDDPSLSPTRVVYRPGGPIADLSSYVNVLFDTCAFRLTHELVLPWSTGVIYRNCTMSQRAPKESYPRGRYEGRNAIIGPAVLTGSVIYGEVTLNGARLGRGRVD